MRPLLVLLLVAVSAPGQLVESARRIPVAGEVDVVVAGGSIAGVAAALEAAAQGRSVMLLGPRTYLGEDRADTLRLWLEDGETPTGTLTEKIFAKPGPASPLRLKRTLEESLTKAGVRFLLGCFVSEVLVDSANRPAGVVIANRAGRQAVIAKVIIDATSNASVAERAGAKFRRFPGGIVEARRVVLGGKAPEGLRALRQIPLPEEKQIYTEYKLDLTAPSLDHAAVAALEQEARDRTYQPGQLRASAYLELRQPPSLISRRQNPFQPVAVDRVYVAGPRASAEFLQITLAERIGRRIGADAAREAKAAAKPVGVRLAGAARIAAGGDVKEVLTGLRPSDQPGASISAAARTLPVLGRYDVVIVGGGTAGAAAAIGAARRGAKVLVAEFQEGLGGTGTLGLIGKPYHGREAGFSKEVPFPSETFTIEDKMEWYRREIRKAGGEIWFGVLGAGAYMDGSRVLGAVLVTAQGRGVALGKVVIDATGNAEVAAAAGARIMTGADATDLAMQGAGLPSRKPGASYVNTDYLLVDETDVVDVWRALVGARMTMDESAYDSGTLIQTRERRRVVGEHILTYLDQIAGRTYPDSIVYSASDYDSHGYPSDDFFALLPHDQRSRQANHPAPGGTAYTPYRCLLPRGLDGLLVVGLGISMERDASALVRMQRDIANQGYAAGVAAATTAANGAKLRDLDVRALQRYLVEIGSLPADALTHSDNFPLPEAEIRIAVQNAGFATNPDEAGKWLAVILTHKSAALPLLRRAFETARPRQKLAYAKLLAFFGERDVVPVLAEALDAIREWDGRILQGKMAEYAHLPTPIDTLILGLGRTGDPRALPALLRKLEMLDAGVTLSHHRSLAIALEQIRDPAAAPALARLLQKPGMRGHASRSLEPLHDQDMERRRRLGPLREIALARALYRCGDHEGLGAAILREYERDLNGLFARHAAAVLAAR